MSTQLAFHNTQFNVISRNNQIWLSSKEIAQALGYAKTNAITHIYNTNPDEFTPGMTEVVESNTSGNLKARSRIFSLRGAHLIAMFARTAVAKEFRRWVLDILDKEAGESIIQPTPTHQTEIHAFCDDHANRAEIIYYQDFKPIFCRVLRPEEIVLTPESMKEWMEMQGVVFFTREEIKNWTVSRLLDIVK